ncbi:glycosyl transferase [Bombiscardovia apis]|uniref:Glycosyl transferase n=1 Tax=Bombiscardovia apis TaxID=2932182 RepID=A0ABN6SGA5_9BIFI|nr:glycosyltransferase family A protein [Bombiscardovia apis]BDR54286.1 glycosyl transferase [Bombiscardovia apis]
MSAEQPLVTAIITSYKRPVETVHRALVSAINQTYPKLEILLVNDCPEDANLSASLEILCQELSATRPVSYISMESNGGACKARNLGARQSSGQYLAFLDDDDEWQPSKIEQQVAAAQSHPEAGLVYCNAILQYDGSDKPDGLLATEPMPSGDIFYQLLGSNFIASCSYPLISRELFTQLGGFNEHMPALQDWELYLRLVKQAPAAYVSEPLARYHFHQGERISAHPERRTGAFEIIHARYQRELSTNAVSASSFLLVGTYLYSVAGNMGQAWRYYRMAVRLDPGKLKRNTRDFFRMALRPFVNTKIV